MSARAEINVRDVPPSIRAAVMADAMERDLSINNVVTGILAQRYGLAWTETKYGYTDAPGESDQWVLRVPPELRDAIRGHAKAIRGGTMTGCVLLALADHYRLPAQAPRARRPSTLDPDIVRAARIRHGEGESIRSLAREYGIARESLTRAIRS
jgi:hypothetical protein